MFELFFLIVVLLAVIVPFLLHDRLKRVIKLPSALIVIEILLGFAILVAGYLFPLYSSFSIMPEYPKLTKQIDEEYYFTQEEYGWAGSMPGKHLEFFKKKEFWPDKKIGHIQWLIGIGDVKAEILDTAPNDSKRLILRENDKLELDTILQFDKGFDFQYRPSQK